MIANLTKLQAYADKKETVFHVVVEAPRGSPVKLKYEPSIDAFMVGRPLPMGLVYPFDWGFVPGTIAEDGDPLDALVRWDIQSHPGVIIPCRALGVLRVEEDAKKTRKRRRNDRIIGVPVDDLKSEHVQEIFDLPKRALEEIEVFFRTAVAFTTKNLEILGWGGPDDAHELIAHGVKSLKR